MRLVVATIGAVLLAATGVLPALEAVLLGVMIILAFRVLTPGEAKNAIDLDVILTMAGGFGLGTAAFDLIFAVILGSGVGASVGLLFQSVNACSKLFGLPFFLLAKRGRAGQESQAKE